MDASRNEKKPIRCHELRVRYRIFPRYIPSST